MTEPNLLNSIQIPDYTEGSVGSPLAGGQVFNMKLNLSSFSNYNATGAITPGNTYFKFPSKGTYLIVMTCDWTTFTILPATATSGGVVLKRWVPTPVLEITSFNFPMSNAGPLSIPLSNPNPLSMAFVYVAQGITDIVEPIFFSSVGNGYAFGVKNITITRLNVLS